MKAAVWVAVGLLLAACSGDDGDKAEPCSLSHRKGTYVQHLEERANGTCGPLSDQVVQLSGGELSLPTVCAYDVQDMVSDDKCKLTRQYTCPLDGQPGVANYTVITTERDGGATLSGPMTITIRDANGDPSCKSTYDMTLTRQ